MPHTAMCVMEGWVIYRSWATSISCHSRSSPHVGVLGSILNLFKQGPPPRLARQEVRRIPTPNSGCRAAHVAHCMVY